jgi:hypothetical protein
MFLIITLEIPSLFPSLSYTGIPFLSSLNIKFTKKLIGTCRYDIMWPVESSGNVYYLCLINGILTQFAEATATNGTNLPTSGGALWKTNSALISFAWQ